MATKNIANLSAVLGLNTKGFDTGLNRAGSGLSAFTARSKATLGQSQRFFEKFTNQVHETSSVVNVLRANLGLLASVATTALSTREIVRYSDTWKTLEGRLSIVTKNTEEMTKVQEELYRIAQNTRSPLEGITNLYTRMQQALTPAQRATTDVMGVTETFAKALAITGESAASAQGAILQFTQALASDFKGAGQELNSIIEQSPRVAQAIANSMGVTVGALKKLAQDGKLSSEVVINALSSMSAEGQKIDKEFANIPTTVSKALTMLDNAMLRYVGMSQLADTGTGALATAIQEVANNFEVLANALLGFGAAYTLKAIAPIVDGFKKALVANVAYIGSLKSGETVLVASERAAIRAAIAEAQLSRERYNAVKALIAQKQALIAKIAAEEKSRTQAARLAKEEKYLATLMAQKTVYFQDFVKANKNYGTLLANVTRGVAAFGRSVMGLLGTNIAFAAIAGGLALIEEKTGAVTAAWEAFTEVLGDALRLMGVALNSNDVFNNLIEEQRQKIDELYAARKRLENLKGMTGYDGGDIDRINKKIEKATMVIENLNKQREALANPEAAKQPETPLPKMGTGEKDKFQAEIDSLEEEIALTSIQLKQFGEKESAIKREQDEIKILNKLRESGRTLNEQERESLEAKLDTLAKQKSQLEDLEAQQKKMEELERDRKKAIEEYANAFESAFEDAIVSGNKLRDVFDGLLQDILKIAIRSSITRPLGVAIGDAFSSGGGGIGDIFSSFRSMLPSFAVGTSYVPSNMTANIHEGEMIVPKYDADLIRQGKFGGSDVIVNITNNSNSTVNTSTSSNGSGINLDVIIDQAVADNIGRRGSKTNQALGFYNNKKLVGRA